MNPAEAALVITAISANDGREPSEAAARALAAALPDVTLQDALDYLPTFYRNATHDKKSWIMPGDILLGVRAMHVERRREAMTTASRLAIEAVDPDDPEVERMGTDWVGLRAAREASQQYDENHVMPGAEIDRRKAAEAERRRSGFDYGL
jgi:hypothetical protein